MKKNPQPSAELREAMSAMRKAMARINRANENPARAETSDAENGTTSGHEQPQAAADTMNSVRGPY